MPFIDHSWNPQHAFSIKFLYQAHEIAAALFIPMLQMKELNSIQGVTGKQDTDTLQDWFKSV